MFRAIAIIFFAGVCLLLAMPTIFAIGKRFKVWWKSLSKDEQL